LIALSVSALPAIARDRYREEFRTELCELTPMQQVGQAAGLVVGSMALRRALTARDVPLTERAATSWKCRIGRHAYVGRRDDNPEMPGRTYQVCDRCGKYFEPPEEPEFDIDKFHRRANYLGG